MSVTVNGNTPEYDLVVVGSGFAGSMTALNFLEECKNSGKKGRVALVEVGKEGERCGASRWTMAYLRLDKNLDFDKAWGKEMERVSGGRADQSYCRKMEVEAGITARYLEDHGVKFIHHGKILTDEKNVLLEFKTDQHFVYPDGGGNAIITTLFEHMNKYDGLEVLWETEGYKLLTNEDGSMAGLQVRNKDGRLRKIHSKTVMLACGGFEGNEEMLQKYIGHNIVDVPLIAPGLVHNKGRGLQMGLDVGAATAGSLSGSHSELVDVRSAKPDAVVWGHNFGVVVNRDCERFYDEGQRHLFATFEMIALETWRDQNQRAYFVTDSTIMNRFRPGWVYDTTDQEPLQGDTIEELAGQLGLPPDKLSKTISEFNAACNDKPFELLKLDGKATSGLKPNKTNWANPIEKPPYFGYEMKANLTFTYGGLKTNLDSQVVSTHGGPIPGLYAAGELTGLFYHEYPPATSVLRSLTFGRIAGKAIAAAL